MEVGLKNEMRERWREHAKNYDSAHAHGVGNPVEEQEWRDIFADKVGSSVLDVGTGTGFVSLIAAESGLDVTGVDWSDGMMGEARRKADERGLFIEFVLSGTEALPFDDESFDYLTSRHVIWTLTDPVAAFKEWYRVLKPGGMVFADYSPRPMPKEAQHYRLEIEEQLPLNREIDPEYVADLFREAGFLKVEIEEREKHAHGHYHHEEDEHNEGEHEHHHVHGSRYLYKCTK